MRRSTTLAAIALRVCLTVLAAAGLAALAGPGLVALAGPVSALAATPAKLSATFVPERLGQRTTLDFGFAFSAPSGQVPPPLTEIELRYPDNLGIALSGLGLEDCCASTLEASGPAGWPANSVMGFGQAYVGIVLGTTTITETTPITILRAPDQEGHLAVLFYAEGSTPVATHIIFAGILLPASAPFGGLVSIGVPLVPTLPGAPNIFRDPPARHDRSAWRDLLRKSSRADSRLQAARHPAAEDLSPRGISTRGPLHLRGRQLRARPHLRSLSETLTGAPARHGARVSAGWSLHGALSER